MSDVPLLKKENIIISEFKETQWMFFKEDVVDALRKFQEDINNFKNILFNVNCEDREVLNAFCKLERNYKLRFGVLESQDKKEEKGK
jgi:phenylpropionate dioxygenase-like ring-hydroxylating dioxygenase large terminal subunit